MSFGLSASDFITVPCFAWKVYIALKTGPSGYQELLQDVSDVYLILKEIKDNLETQELPPERGRRLERLASNCNNVLEDIEQLLVRYESLATNSKRTWDRMKFGLEDVQRIKIKLHNSYQSLTAFNSALTQASVARIEKLLKQYIAEKQSGSREGTVVSVQTLQSIKEDEAAWREVARDLKDVGVTDSMMQTHRKFIVEFIQRAIANGELEEIPDETEMSYRKSLTSLLGLPSIQEVRQQGHAESRAPQPMERPTGKPTPLVLRRAPTADSMQQILMPRAFKKHSMKQSARHTIALPYPSMPETPLDSTNESPQLEKSVSYEQSRSSELPDDVPLASSPSLSDSVSFKSDFAFSVASPLSSGITSAETSMSRSPPPTLASFDKSRQILGLADKSDSLQRTAPSFKKPDRQDKDLPDLPKTRSSSIKDRFKAPKLLFASSSTSVPANESEPDQQIVKSLTPLGSAGINEQDEAGDTALHRAAMRNDIYAVSSLVNCGASLDIRNARGDTPLHIAAILQNGQIVSTLLNKGADPEVANKNGSRLLHIVASQGNTELMYTILATKNICTIIASPLPDQEAKDNVGNTPLHCAAMTGNISTFEVMYDSMRVEQGMGCKDTWSTIAGIPNDKGEWPVHAAARIGNVKMLSKLCKHGSKRLQRDTLLANDDNFNKPVHFAALNGHVAAVEFLYRHAAKCGVRVENASNGSGHTPLYLAVENGHAKVVQELLAHKGVDVNQDCPLGSGQTPLLAAKRLGHTHLERMLMAGGASVAVPGPERRARKEADGWASLGLF